jgi:hypothetical protein
LLISPKSITVGLKYGLLLGVALGASMGLGSYTWMPIPLTLAWAWCIGSIVELALGGLVVGAIIKE